METNTATATKRVAIATYNRIGTGQYDNGKIEGNGVELFVAQNGHKLKWAADNDDSDSNRIARCHAARQAAKQIDLTDMDEVYLYVGANGGEEMIIATKDLPAEKVIYVLCSCNWYEKKRLIKQFGNCDSRIIECECGGRETLAQIAQKILRGES